MGKQQDLYAQAKIARDALNQVLSATAKGAFGERAQVLFDAHPEIESFSWAQYTPYYNDGDECVFSARTDRDSVDVNGESLEDRDEDPNDPSPDYDDYKTPEQQKEWSRIYNAWRDRRGGSHAVVEEFLSQFDDDELKDMFGDHIEVSVYRDGTVETTDYEHE